MIRPLRRPDGGKSHIGRRVNGKSLSGRRIRGLGETGGADQDGVTCDPIQPARYRPPEPDT